MAHKTEIKYRSFDELLASVQDDLPLQMENGFIEPSQLIKVAIRVNKDLNVAFERVNEDVLEIEDYKVKLPDNFYVMNFAHLCYNGQRTYIDPLYRHDHIEGRCVSKPICGDPCNKEIVTELEIIKTYRTVTTTWRNTQPIKFTDGSYLRTDCPNRTCHSDNTAYIRDGFIMTNVPNGYIYINYTPTMEDSSGDLLVLDHDMINSYYENALKVKVFETMLSRGEDVVNQLKYFKEELRKSRIEAKTIVATPGFNELVHYFKENRKNMLKRYYSTFI